jgi:hypothetical protein
MTRKPPRRPATSDEGINRFIDAQIAYAGTLRADIAKLVAALEKIEGGFVPPDFDLTPAGFHERVSSWMQGVARAILAKHRAGKQEQA